MLYRLLYILPKNLLSHFTGILVDAKLPFSLHVKVKLWFIRNYRVDCADAEFPVEAYETLGRFFIRRLKPGSRPISEADLVSPVDGTLTQGGRFDPARPMLTQIKGMDYSLADLVGSRWDLEGYSRGGYLTIYLAPYNYHRIHAPIQGEVTQAGYIPGALWPVNTWSVRAIPGLFTVNERITVELSGPLGKILVVMVGATNVGKITLDFPTGLQGNKLPRMGESIWRPAQPLSLEKGAGLGCFELGSTVILILSDSLTEKMDFGRFGPAGETLRMGQGLMERKDPA